VADRIVALPVTRRGIHNEAAARADAAGRLRNRREAIGQTEAEFAACWTRALDCDEVITAGMVRAFERPTGPTPPWHWAIVAMEMMPEAVSSPLLCVAP
jgi:hypothetical protein